MSLIDIFAWIVLLILVASGIAIFFIAGSLPGHIAKSRGHPWATAVTVAGWVQLQTHPFVEDPADVFPRNARHRGDVALAQFLPDDDTAAAEFVAESLGEVEQRSAKMRRCL